MRWILLACSNFIAANLFVALLLSGNNASDVEITEYSLGIIHYANNQESVERIFGTPFVELKDKWVYKTNDGTKLTINWKKKKLSNAKIEFTSFRKFNEISHVEGNFLVTKETPKEIVEKGWIHIAIPENGQTFTINRDGNVSSVEWRQPWQSGSEKTDIITILNTIKSLPPYLVMK